MLTKALRFSHKAVYDNILPALLAIVLTTTLMINAIQLRNCWEAREDANGVKRVDYVPIEQQVPKAEGVDYVPIEQQVPKAEAIKLKLTAPAQATVGQLVEVSANTGASFKFVVKGVDPSNVRVLDHSVVFSSPVATTVDVFVAVMVGEAFVVEHVTVQVGTLGLPEAKPIVPVPVTLMSEIAPLISDVKTDDKMKELREIAGAFKQVAVLIKDGAVSSVEDAVRITQTMVKKATDKSKDAWKKVIDRIQDDTKKAADAGKLKTLADHARHWEMIADALDPNPPR